ncbi:MAG: kynureninase [Gemmatimonadales bacterium]
MTAFGFEASEEWAREQDRADPLAWSREAFELPRDPGGEPLAYCCGNSLGLMPRSAGEMVRAELDGWARLGVEGHFEGDAPWYSYHELFRAPLARLVGAAPDEVVAMNSLTVNLHLMLVSFYRPGPGRRAILIEEPAFPSDRYALTTHLAARGEDPERTLLLVRPREGEATIRTEDLEGLLETRGREIALVFLSGVQFATGQRFDLARLAAAAHRAGCRFGVNLAHAIGNVELALHEWNVDFAVWCSYKYLNGGPGAVGGCFVHRRHGEDRAVPRLAGWWGNDPATRFRLHENQTFVPAPGADGWQLSNPPILAMAPLRASLDLFDRAGLPALREKSARLTGYLEYLLDQAGPGRLRILTPPLPEARGCQLSIQVRGGGREALDALRARGVVGDFREPDIIRLAPVPLYNTYRDVWRAARALLEVTG